jgi:uncharacterized protein (UPF0548 family)
MLSLRKPSAESIRRFCTEQSVLDFSYKAVGATATTPPAGYAVDRTRIKLGAGESVFHSARAAFQRWEQFRLGWVEAWPPDTPIQPGEVIAVMGHAIGLWWLNSCRIVYVVDETGPVSKFGFAYGTLPGHVESGEERFIIECIRAQHGGALRDRRGRIRHRLYFAAGRHLGHFPLLRGGDSKKLPPRSGERDVDGWISEVGGGRYQPGCLAGTGDAVGW